MISLTKEIDIYGNSTQSAFKVLLSKSFLVYFLMKRSILGLLYLIQGMRHIGIDVDERLNAVGINVDALDPSSIIQPELERTIQAIIAQDVQPELGFKVGQHYALAGYGPLLMLLVTSPTVGDALNNGIRFQCLTHLSGKLTLEKGKSKVGLCYEPVSIHSDVDVFRAQCEVSGTVKFVRDIYQMIGMEFPKVQIDLPFSKPQSSEVLAAYYEYFGKDLNFDSQQLKIYFDSKILEIKLPSTDQITFAVHLQRCIKEIERLKEHDLDHHQLIQSIHDYLNLQTGQIPTMAETAKALNIPERTLRHQLQQLNTSYKQIREQLIKNKALRLIEYREYPIEVIAEMLGYSEPAAFNHAFKRWFGSSPRQYGK